MTRDPEWFLKEGYELLDKWREEGMKIDFIEYREKYSTRRFRKYLHNQNAYREKMLAKGICV